MNDMIVFPFEGREIRVIFIDGDPWWVALDVCRELGYLNGRQAIADHCKPKGVSKRYSLTPGGEQLLTYINEPNLLRLITRSKRPDAVRFEELVFEEILPTIRKTGSYSVSNQLNEQVKITDQLSIPHQKQNSKEVNGFKYRQGGKFAVINNNKRTQKEVTGKTPMEWRKIGKEMGLSSRQTNSGKESLRHVRPDGACAVSLADELIAKGIDPEKVYPVAREATTVYRGLIAIGVRPYELDAK